jgi:restriction system protein
MNIILLLSALAGLTFVILLLRKYSRPSPRQQLPPKTRSPKVSKTPSSEQSSSQTLKPLAPPSKQFSHQNKKHQKNIERANAILKQFRSQHNTPELPYVLGTLRKITPYVFEELLLSCCLKQGWKIKRNFRYTNDRGVDGRVIIAGKLYLIQAKRYEGHIKSEHLHDFQCTIRREQAQGGFFIHTGKTGSKCKTILRQYPRITLISGQKLVNFVLAQKVRIVGISI